MIAEPVHATQFVVRCQRRDVVWNPAVLAKVLKAYAPETSIFWPRSSLAITTADPKTFHLQFSVNTKKKAELETELFGKRGLFTDRDGWSIADVIAGYRPQSGIESGFRQMKDPKVVSAGPMFHWTDHKVRVHMLTFVLALMTAHLMRRQAKRAGIDASVRELLATLNGIQETVLVYREKKDDRDYVTRSLKWTRSNASCSTSSS